VRRNGTPVFAIPSPLFSGAYYGGLNSVQLPVDVMFEAGETPSLEFGVPASVTIFADTRNRLSVTGYLVDTTP
jgi:hypothetical protein